MNNVNDKVYDMNNLCVCVFFFHFLVVWPWYMSNKDDKVDDKGISTYIISMGGRAFSSVRFVVRPVVHPSFHPSKAKNGKRRRRTSGDSTFALKAWPAWFPQNLSTQLQLPDEEHGWVSTIYLYNKHGWSSFFIRSFRRSSYRSSVLSSIQGKEREEEEED